MPRTRSLSIYLLKPNLTPDDALDEDHNLIEIVSRDPNLARARCFTLTREAKRPWWEEYLSLPETVPRESLEALVFYPVDDRWFALPFGLTIYQLKPNSYEHDFGVNVATMLLHTDRVRSADSVEPSGGRRVRTQLSRTSPLAELGLDSYTSIVRAITGRVQDGVLADLRQVTGSSSLRVSSQTTPARFGVLLSFLLEQYRAGVGPHGLNGLLEIRGVTDPTTIAELNAAVVRLVGEEDTESLSLMVPEIVEYGTRDCIKFSGLRGREDPTPNIGIDALLDYIDRRSRHPIDIDVLKKLKVWICDPTGDDARNFSLFSSLVAEVDREDGLYHLSEGVWHRFERDLVARLTEELRGHFAECDYPAFLPPMRREEDYNRTLAGFLPDSVMLDRGNIGPDGRRNIEPCDVLSRTPDGGLKLIHVKRNTNSGTLSHLFNQGVNSWKALISEPAYAEIGGAL